MTEQLGTWDETVMSEYLILKLIRKRVEKHSAYEGLPLRRFIAKAQAQLTWDIAYKAGQEGIKQYRPEMCKDCPTFENGCEGSNQEDCARQESVKADPKMKEKILTTLTEHCQTHEHRGCDCSPEEAEGCWGSLASKIALFGDVKKERDKLLQDVRTKLVDALQGVDDIHKIRPLMLAVIRGMRQSLKEVK